MVRSLLLVGLALTFLVVPALRAQDSFVNWESPHVYPLDRTPDGTKLLAVNTADHRLEVFAIEARSLTHTTSIPVGLDPVSVRARTDTEVWVVNHISDSVSIVDLETGHVVATVATDDEPTDVVFAGDPERAFVSCSQANRVLVFDLADLSAAPDVVEIFGEEPRALAVSTDGTTVYAAIFESGNGTTVLSGPGLPGDVFAPDVLAHPESPTEGVNPPPNDGDEFSPPQNPDNPAPPEVSLIVRKNAADAWLDDNGGDWTEFVSGDLSEESGRVAGWDLPDHDVAVIDAGTLDVSYFDRLMTSDMALAVNPDDDTIVVVGTEATNEIRFEPNVKGTFVRVHAAVVDPATPGDATIVDLNPHLDYTETQVAQSERDKSLGDPRCIVFNAAGTTAWIVGKGSNNVIAINESGTVTTDEPIEVGEGPTGLVLDEDTDRLFVLNHFAATISVVDTDTQEELEQVAFFDPTPLSIRLGRPHLYDTHTTSGLGQLACASCHIDARLDRLAWDLGDPSGSMKEFTQNCLDDGCEDWHPMKGPMLTQTLQDIIGKEPLHWRGDRDGIREFNGAFIGLLGDDDDLSESEMQEFEDFLATIHYPPNPFRNFDNSLPTDLPLDGHFNEDGDPLPNGDAVAGLADYRTGDLEGPGFNCVTCHTLPTGVGIDGDLDLATMTFEAIEPGPNGEAHALITTQDSSEDQIKVPHLRNLYERVGFEATQTENTAGFGFLHDGSIDSIARFLGNFPGVVGDQQIADLLALMLAFSGADYGPGEADEPPGLPSLSTHAAVGGQVTFDGDNNDDTDLLDRYQAMQDLADEDAVGLVAHGRLEDEARGFAYIDGAFQTDREAQTFTPEALLEEAAAGSEITFTVVPSGTELRIGIDRDDDGFYDLDEIDNCSDPTNRNLIPGKGCGAPQFDRGDCNATGNFDIADPIRILGTLFLDEEPFDCNDACDANDSGLVDLADAIALLGVLFLEGDVPPPPYGACGADGTPDDLDCETFDPCD